MDYKEIKAVIDLMTKNHLTEFELEKPDFKIRVKRGSEQEVAPSVPYSAPSLISAPPSLPLVAPAAVNPPLTGLVSEPAASKDSVIVSPMVGTFYRSPSPDSAPFVEIGKEVGPETVVCIIEAMKVMNEIKAEMGGVITEILAENGKPVEFGKPLYRIRPR